MQIIQGNYENVEDKNAEARLLAVASSNVIAILEQYLESGQKDKYFLELEQILQQLSAVLNKKSLVVQQVFCSISLYLLAYMNRWELQEKVIGKLGEIHLLNCSKFNDWKEAATYLREVSLCVFALQKLEQTKRADNIIAHIQQFITNHLGEDLSLVRLSEEVFLNPSYLSRIFKQETKRNLTEFIDTARIQKAKQLLLNDNIKINEVARQVGYETATSFTRFFKNNTGCSPQDYRDKQKVKIN